MPIPENSKLSRLDIAISAWMYKYGKPLLRYSLAVVFIWFGYLKVIQESPAADLVAKTAYWFDADTFGIILGYWEILIGLFLCFRITIRLAIALLVLQMPGTFLPLVILPEITFNEFPLKLTLEGQYIIKNLIIISAAIVIGGTLREKEMINQKMPSADAE